MKSSQQPQTPTLHNEELRYTRSVDNEGVVTYILDKPAKSVDPLREERRDRRFRLLAHAAKLLPSERVARCMRCCGQGGVAVVLNSDGVAGFRGVQTCGSVWACPVCSARISATRREHLNDGLRWGRGMGFIPVLLTLTMRHSAGDSLLGNLELLKAAKKKLHQSKAWRAIKGAIVGHVTATEVTFGDAGWHPHFHMLLLLDCPSEADALGLMETARAAWTRALGRVGLTCNENGYHLQDASAADDYVTKWGAGEELTLTGTKESKNAEKGRTPWQLLADSDAGDTAAGARFVEYTQVFHGRRQLVWSPGLQEAVGIEEVSDEDIAAGAGEEVTELIIIPKSAWRLIVRRNLRAEVLDVAEQAGRNGVEAWLHALWVQHRLNKGGT